MQRSFWWSTILILAILMAPMGGVFGVPAKPVRAEPLAPAVPAQDDEVILLTSAGQIRVDDPVTPSGYAPATWNSPDTGWAMVAAGDFNGDGDAEIVATKGDTIKAFDPIIQPGSQPVVFERSLGTNRTIQLLVTGDFDGDGKDEIAIVYYYPSTSLPWTLLVYDGGTNATAAQWTVPFQESYNAVWQDMSAGDVNNDGADDLVMVRNADRRIKIYNGRTWTVLAEQGSYATNWFAVATGNLYTAYSGDEIALLRQGISAQVNGLILLRVVGNALADLGGTYKYNPDFTSIATGDVNGDGDDEVMMLRNPIDPRTSLQMVNPAGAAIRNFAEATGNTSPLFTIVRMGDVDGDGRAEVIIEKVDRYRIYYEPEANSSYVDYTGAYRTMATVSNIPTMAVANIDGAGVPLGPVLSVSPQSLSFDLKYLESSSTQDIGITNTGTGGAISWKAEVVDGTAWLQLNAASGTTPGTLGVSVNTSAVLPGTHTGKIRITATSGGTVQNSPKDITVNLTLSGPTLAVTPSTLTFDLEYRQPSPTQNVSITNSSTSEVLSWQAQVTAGDPWLKLSATSGTTSGTLGVSVDTTAATPGTYVGKIRVTATGAGPVSNTPLEVTVNLTIRGVAMVISPKLLTFSLKYGDVSPIKPVSITSAGGSSPIAWQAELLEGFAWLQVYPMEGTSPSTMNVSVNTRAVPPGTYTGTIRVRALDSQVADSPQFITVDLTVADGGVVVTPDQVTIKRLVGAPPTTTQVLIERPGIPTAWTATVLPAALADLARAKLAAGEYQVTETGIVLDGMEATALDWLTFTPSSGTTLTTMTLTVQGDTPGIYEAIIFVNSVTGTRELHVKQWIANQFHDSRLPLVTN